MSSDFSEFHQVFYEESFEALEPMERSLLELDSGAPDLELINTIFRGAHSIKGGAGMLGFVELADFTHLMETLLDQVREGSRPIDPDTVDLLLRSVDVLRALLTALQEGKPAGATTFESIVSELNALLSTDPETSTPEPEVAPQPASDVAVSGAQDAAEDDIEVKDPADQTEMGEVVIFGAAENLEPSADAAQGEETKTAPLKSGDATTAGPSATDTLTAKPAAQAAVGGDSASRARSSESTSVRVSIDKVDALINLVGELVITQSMLSRFGHEFEMSEVDDLRKGLAQLMRNTRELQESVMRIRMLPIKFSFNRFPRLVRDLCGKLGKKVTLKVTGEQTELDKTVLEKLGDPLVHIVRNAIDHGIEMPEDRVAAGKEETGTLELTAYHAGGNIVIEVIDDGAGLDGDKILEKAKAKGLVGENESLTEEQIHNLIFAPGFSTAEQVSELSGRGVGMDVVRRNISDLGGTVDLKSTRGNGSKLTIRLPLTLAILDGQLVRVGNETYIIPLVSILESLQPREEYVNEIAGRAEVYRVRDQQIPIIRLYNALGVEPDSRSITDGLIVVADVEGGSIGLLVDDLLGQQQIVIKSLEANFQQVPGLSGATILGDGTVALILDVPGLAQQYFGRSTLSVASAA